MVFNNGEVQILCKRRRETRRVTLKVYENEKSLEM